MARDRDLVMPANGMDLPFHRVNVGDGCEVEILAPDEGLEIGQEPLADAKIPGDCARLDHGGALPVLPDAFVIDEGARKRDGRRGRGWVGAQPVIDPVDIPIHRALLKELGDALGKARVELGRSVGRPRCDLGIGVVKDHEIDVAREVELASPVLAERQHDQARTG
jgi:hypothetical protein